MNLIKKSLIVLSAVAMIFTACEKDEPGHNTSIFAKSYWKFVEFEYDALGRRTAKIVKPHAAGSSIRTGVPQLRHLMRRQAGEEQVSETM